MTEADLCREDARYENLPQSVDYVVRATHAERYFLWCIHAEGAAKHGWSGPLRRVPWVAITSGNGAHVGHVKIDGEEFPVVLSFLYAKIGSKLVLFYEATSLVVDYRMAEAWLKANVPAYAAGKECIAGAFADCLFDVAPAPIPKENAR